MHPGPQPSAPLSNLLRHRRLLMHLPAPLRDVHQLAALLLLEVAYPGGALPQQVSSEASRKHLICVLTTLAWQDQV